MKFFAFTLLFISSYTLQAQKLSGLVLDSESKEPVPFAHLVAGENRNVTNLDGRFVLQLLESHDDSLSISFIGYETQRIPIALADSFLTIELIPSLTELDAVVIHSDFGEQLVRKSMNRIFVNCNLSRMKLQGYYKESMNLDTKLSYIAEGIVDIYVPLDYQRSTELPLVSPIKTRRRIIDTLDFDLITGHAGDMAQSSIWRKKSFLNSDHFNHYDFIYGGYQQVEDQGIYIVDFEPSHSRGNAKGRIYIQEGTYAILKLEYEMLTSDKQNWEEVFWVEEYQEVQGLFELFRVSYQGTYLSSQKYTSELIVNRTESIDQVPALGFYDQKASFFEEASDDFDDTFWGEYNFLELDETEKLSVK